MQQSIDTVLVTGGGRGIGLAIARRFAEAGYNVAVLDRDQAALETAARTLAETLPVDLIAAVPCDVTEPEDVQRAVNAIQGRFGRIDVLVNNAGIVRDSRLVKMAEVDWDAVIATNLKSLFLTCKAVVPGMIERQHGRIINMSSRAWLGGFGQTNYAAAKGGVVSFTRSLALEVATKGITVNAIAPGIINTPLFQSFAPEVQARLKETVPARRIGQSDDVAEVCIFFADRKNSYVTGQLLYVCGGRSLAGPSV